MDKVREFPAREIVVNEASEWLIRLDSEKQLTPQELQSLREWMHRSPAHRDELVSLGQFWSNQSLVALPIPLEQLYYQGVKKHKSEARQFRYHRPVWATAMATIVIILSALIVNPQWIPGRIKSPDPALYATAVGQQRTVTLPDGSEINLNTNSQIKVEYNREFRNIRLLQGEAHFTVARNKARPFRVYAGRGRVQAVGTAFTVYYRENTDVDVTVTEGKVALAVVNQDNKPRQPQSSAPAGNTKQSQTPGSPLADTADSLGELEAGQVATIIGRQNKKDNKADKLRVLPQVTTDELERRNAWRSGLLIFDGDSLEDVVHEIGRYATLSIEIVDPEISQVRIGGRFKVDRTMDLFHALEANFGLQITWLDYDHVQISSAQKNKTQ